MDTLCMAERNNRTIYVMDVLIEKANALGKTMDRSTSRIIEYALIEYLKKKGIDSGVDIPESE